MEFCIGTDLEKVKDLVEERKLFFPEPEEELKEEKNEEEETKEQALELAQFASLHKTELKHDILQYACQYLPM